MQNPKRLTILLVILGLALLSSAFFYGHQWYVARQSTATPTPFRKPSTFHFEEKKVVQTTISTADWKLLQGEGFMVRYPQSWHVTPNEMNGYTDVSFTPPINPGATFGVSAGGDKSPDQPIEDYVRQTYRNWEFDDNINSVITVMVNGKQGVEIAYGGSGSKTILMPASDQKHIISLTFIFSTNRTPTVEEIASYQEVFYAMAAFADK